MEENGKLVKVDYYQVDTLPDGLKEIAKKQGFKSEGLIVVKTLIGKTVDYQFEKIEDSVDGILNYMHNVAEKDGVDLYKTAGFGFIRLGEEGLQDFTSEEIFGCKEIIKQVIKETGGYTDASIISQKYGLPLKLVAGCFDSLIKSKDVGEINE